MNPTGKVVFTRQHLPVQKAYKQAYTKLHYVPGLFAPFHYVVLRIARATFHLLSSRGCFLVQSRLLLPPKTPKRLLLRHVNEIGGSRRLLLGSPASRSGCSRLSVCKAFATQKPTNTKSGLCSKNIGRQLSVPHPSLASTFAPLAERLASFVFRLSRN